MGSRIAAFEGEMNQEMRKQLATSSWQLAKSIKLQGLQPKTEGHRDKG
jgi:hypothetical protein